MKDIKIAFLSFGICIFFSIITAYTAAMIAGGEAHLVFYATFTLPVICMFLYSLIFQTKEFILLIFSLLMLPFQLFSKKRNTETNLSSTGDKDKTNYGRSSIAFSMIVYGLMGWIISRYYEGSFWVFSYILLGFCWGKLMYMAFQKGILEKDDMA